MRPVCVIRDIAGIFIKGGIWARICVTRACQFIAVQWPWQIDSWVWTFLKSGWVTGSFAHIRVWGGKARLPWNRDASVSN